MPLIFEFPEPYGKRFNFHDVGIALREGGMHYGKVGCISSSFSEDEIQVALVGGSIDTCSFNFDQVSSAFPDAYDQLQFVVFMRTRAVYLLKSKNEYLELTLARQEGSSKYIGQRCRRHGEGAFYTKCYCIFENADELHLDDQPEMGGSKAVPQRAAANYGTIKRKFQCYHHVALASLFQIGVLTNTLLSLFLRALFVSFLQAARRLNVSCAVFLLILLKFPY
ncbi:hypothetical protein M422DRAFT_42363 [Sphaerobolus stellatus SS14]|nr:hypothetical protein M422DRAFT_42363 [Sphaerobolus stellatus SS14]